MYLKDKKFSVRVRLSAVEFEFLHKLAEVHNSTLSSEVRNCIFQSMVSVLQEGQEDGDK